MASFVDGGSLAFDQMMYAPKSRDNLEFLQNRSQHITQNLTEAGRNFFQGARDTWNDFFGEGAARLARAVTRTVASLWETNVVRALETIGQMQNAPLVMQRGIMSDPYIKEMYLKQKIDGYSDTYVNRYGDTQGHDNYDYRRVNDGIVLEKEGGGWEAWTYFEELEDSEDALYFDQQVEMLHSIGNIVRMIRRGKDDPTSRFNSSL